LLVRLPAASASQASGYWAFAKILRTALPARIHREFEQAEIVLGFRAAKHPMVGNPCSRTVFDPLKLTNLPGACGFAELSRKDPICARPSASK